MINVLFGSEGSAQDYHLCHVANQNYGTLFIDYSMTAKSHLAQQAPIRSLLSSPWNKFTGAISTFACLVLVSPFFNTVTKGSIIGLPIIRKYLR